MAGIMKQPQGMAKPPKIKIPAMRRPKPVPAIKAAKAPKLAKPPKLGGKI